MRLSFMTVGLLATAALSSAAPGPGALAILCSDPAGCSAADGPVVKLGATGQFTSVDMFDTGTSTPLLSAISGYGYVLAYTNEAPANGAALGDLLANYYDLGGKRLVVSTYAFSPSWVINGRIRTGNYAALTTVDTGDVSGNLVATAPSNPVFTGITLSSVTYFHNSNFSHSALAAGATLLATDGAGINMIATSANGVVNANLFPGNETENNSAFWLLMASLLKNGGTASVSVPAIGTIAGLILIAGLALLTFRALRHQPV